MLTDRNAELSLRQVLSQKNNFSNVHEKTPNYYYSSSAYWFRIPVKNNLAENKQLYLDVLFPTLDHVKLYVVRTTGILMILSSIFLPVRFSYQFGLAMLFIVSLVLMIFSINAWRHGQTEVRFFVLAQSVTWIGSLLFALMIIGVLPFHMQLLNMFLSVRHPSR